MSRSATSLAMVSTDASDKSVCACSAARTLRPAKRHIDWLGPGVYFWEGDPVRAWEWAKDRGYSEPFVIGAIIDLGECLDLTLRENLEYLSIAYSDLRRVRRQAKSKLPSNKDGRRLPKRDKVLRFLECAVITHLHHMVADAVAEKRYLDLIQCAGCSRGRSRVSRRSIL